MSDYTREATVVVWGHSTYTPERCDALIAEVAAALEAAEKRGRVAGLREAASAAHNFAAEMANRLARAEEVEKS